MTDDTLRAALIGLAFERKSTGELCWCGQSGTNEHFPECLAARAALASATDEGDSRSLIVENERLRAALLDCERARPAVPALDVETVARAMFEEGIAPYRSRSQAEKHGFEERYRRNARDLIARYAALRSKEPTE